MGAYVREAAPKAHRHELMNLLFELPYCRIQNVTERKIAVRQTASGYLKELLRVSVREEKVVGREKLFIHPKLMRLLTIALIAQTYLLYLWMDLGFQGAP